MSNIDNLAQELGKLLLAKQWKIAVAESCTAGLLSAAITSISGSSNWFDRGYVTYSNESKEQMLGVSSEVLEKEGAVSEVTALEMVVGVLSKSSVDVALSITGIAGPEGGSEDKPVGTVWIGIAGKGISPQAKCLNFSGDRESIRLESVQEALKLCIELCK